MRVYISGPISGIPDRNANSFRDGIRFMRAEAGKNPSLAVINPLDIGKAVTEKFERLGIKTEPAWEDFMREDIKALADSSCVFFLPGWEKSRGAVIEHFIAQNLGIPCLKTKSAFKKFLKELEEQNAD